jgi:hypothetical protein
MDKQLPRSAANGALATPEILEYVLQHLLADLLPPTNRHDAQSESVQHNARILLHLLHCCEVGPVWRGCIMHGPPALQHALFLSGDFDSTRFWDQQDIMYPNQRSYFRGLAYLAPELNPILQTVFDGQKFRYW